jgi:ornithine carbamoyltransferase
VSVRHFLSLRALQSGHIVPLVERAVALKGGAPQRLLRGKTVGLLFRKTSTRTRTSFTVAALRLGAYATAFGPQDLQTNTGESVADTAAVLSRYLDALVIRTAASIDEMRIFASQRSMAVINAMSACEHPTQAIADLSIILDRFGRLDDLHVLYLGEGNNTAAALALAIGQIPGMRLSLRTPAGYALTDDIRAAAGALCRQSGAHVHESHDPRDLPPKVDVVYTTRWQTTGTSKPDPEWRTHFQPFTVDASVMTRVAHSGTVFMHDLPAVRGEEVSAEVLDGPRSVAFDQAEHKMYGAMAILEWCLAPAREDLRRRTLVGMDSTHR